MTQLWNRIILGSTSIYVMVPVIFIFFDKTSITSVYFSNLLASILTITTILSLVNWFHISHCNPYIFYDRVFVKICLVLLVINCFSETNYKNAYYLLSFLLISCLSYCLSCCFTDYVIDSIRKIKLLNNIYIKDDRYFKPNRYLSVVFHILFRYFAFIFTSLSTQYNCDYILSFSIKYFTSIAFLIPLNKFVNNDNYHIMYFLTTIYFILTTIMYIIITGILDSNL